MARRSKMFNSIAERLRDVELRTWEQSAQIIRRIGIEVSWAKIAGVMISGEGVESSNFVTGVSGWQIDGDGNAEFNNVTVRGDIVGNWDGADPANLATPDLTATEGFYLDSSVGSSQWMGDIFVGGDIELIGSGALKTASSGERFEFSFTDRNRLFMYTGDTDETYVGSITFDIIGSGAAATMRTNYELGSLNIVGPDVVIQTTSVTRDDATDASFIVATRNAGDASANQFLVWTSGQLQVPDGSVTDPPYTFISQTNTGLFKPATSQLALTINGVQELLIGVGGFNVPNVYTTNSSGGNTVYVDSDGRLHRNTSALKGKKNVHVVVDLADIDLVPATWTKDGVPDMGLIADWLAVQHPLLGIYNSEGELEDYRDRAVLAVMSLKLERLEREVAELKVAA